MQEVMEEKEAANAKSKKREGWNGLCKNQGFLTMMVLRISPLPLLMIAMIAGLSKISFLEFCMASVTSVFVFKPAATIIYGAFEFNFTKYTSGFTLSIYFHCAIIFLLHRRLCVIFVGFLSIEKKNKKEK